MRRPMRSYLAIASVVILIAAGTVFFIWLSVSEGFERNLASSVAKIIVQDQARSGYKSPEGAIVIRIAPRPSSFGPDSWLDAPYLASWKYEKGTMEPGSYTNFAQIGSAGKVFIFIFMIQKISGNEALVDVATFYPASDTPGFAGGGNASHRLFRYINQSWKEISEDTYENWD